MSAPNERESEKVESKAANAGDASRGLQQRIRQQEILAELGVSALQGASLDQLLTDTVRLTAQGLDADFCKVLELLPSENQFLVRAGVGWSRGVVGVAKVGADLELACWICITQRATGHLQSPRKGDAVQDSRIATSARRSPGDERDPAG